MTKYLTLHETADNMDKTLDNSKYQIHFLNGYIDIRTKEFKKREIGKSANVTYVIGRDYKESKQKHRDEIFKILDKIYDKKCDMDAVFMCAGSAITGDSKKDQTSLFAIGVASSGKSFFMEMISAAFCQYIFELKNDTFENGNPKMDKIFNTFLIHRYIRIAWVNEFSDRRIDGSSFKDFIDGKIKTTSLFEDGQNRFVHQAKILATMNDIPNYVDCKGMHRRINAISHTSQFIDESEGPEDITKRIFHKKKSLTDDINENPEMLNAIVDIVIEYAYKWFHGETLKITDNMKNTMDTFKTSNDKMSDFLDTFVVRTDNDNDKIGKEHMLKKYKEMYPQKLLTINQMITNLRDKGINYNANMRVNDVRGAFTKVKFRSLNDDSDEDDYEHGVDKKDLSVKMSLFEQYEFHKKMANELQIKMLEEWDKINENKPKDKIIKKESKKQADDIKKLFGSAANSFF